MGQSRGVRLASTQPQRLTVPHTQVCESCICPDRAGYIEGGIAFHNCGAQAYAARRRQTLTAQAVLHPALKILAVLDVFGARHLWFAVPSSMHTT